VGNSGAPITNARTNAGRCRQGSDTTLATQKQEVHERKADRHPSAHSQQALPGSQSRPASAELIPPPARPRRRRRRWWLASARQNVPQKAPGKRHAPPPYPSSRVKTLNPKPSAAPSVACENRRRLEAAGPGQLFGSRLGRAGQPECQRLAPVVALQLAAAGDVVGTLHLRQLLRPLDLRLQGPLVALLLLQLSSASRSTGAQPCVLAALLSRLRPIIIPTSPILSTLGAPAQCAYPSVRSS
jgi:hypothetical protein